MSFRTLVLNSLDSLPLDVPDLLYLFGLYVDVIGITVLPGHAYVVVASHKQACRAVTELEGRFFQTRDGDFVPLRISIVKSRSEKPHTVKLPPVRNRPDLVQPAWQFVVGNIDRDTDFRFVLELFAQFGTVCWSYRHVCGTHGAVIVKTSARWKQVLDALRDTTLAGHRLRIAFCKNDVRSRELPESVGSMPRGTPWDSRVNIWAFVCVLLRVFF